MDLLTLEEIAKAANGEILNFKENTLIKGISIDSRKIKEGCLFICLEGNRADGHSYIRDAVKLGAKAVLTQKDVDVCDIPVIKTPSTLRGLQGIASYYRQKYDIPVVAVTGSVGKTTTKEFVYSILSAKYKTLKSEGNLNSDIGMPLSVFGLDSTYEAAVFEMGMSGFGEIATMTHIAKPHIAVITNIGVSHIERLGTRENILKAKLEITQGFTADGIMILNGDDPLLKNIKPKLGFETLYYGIDNKNCDYKAQNVISCNNYTEFEVVTPYGEFFAKINTLGLHNVYNALVAISVGFSLGLSIEEIKDGLLFFKNAAMRQSIKEYGSISVIDDCYNASPDSMEAAIKVLYEMKKTTKIAVLADMLELGELSKTMHKKVGNLASRVDYLLCYGEKSIYYIEGALENGMDKEKVFHFESLTLCADFLKNKAFKDCAILFKGSRGMKCEECLERFLEGKND
jgi:UDP-N-acetylmuramoyl-tripeptide--D-alanyl-D-alanine ligase